MSSTQPQKEQENDSNMMSAAFGMMKNALNDVAHRRNGSISHEHESEAHQIFREQPGHSDKAARNDHVVPGIEHPGSVGVIYVMDRAMSNGFHYGAEGWANFGQGAPETGDIPGAVPKPTNLDLAKYGHLIHEYGPTTGIQPLREKVAEYYNDTFRKSRASKYTADNICIVPGGRAGLSRVASVISPILLGYQLPEYAAYEPMLAAFKNLIPIPTQLAEEDQYRMKVEDLRRTIRNQGLTTVLLSNPRNPTGQIIEGKELRDLVEMANEMDVTTILDEFYSWYLHEGEEGRAVSAAEYIEDVNSSPLILIDGLTKNWRCPGWRVCWVVGPKDLISALNQAGSYLDGGASHPMQCLALEMMDKDRIVQDRIALQRHFRMKRKHVLDRLAAMGLTCHVPPQATFYIWLNLSCLPHPLNSGLAFFEELLKEQVIVTPGIFFDVNPAHRRNIIHSPCEPFVRLSFGPPLEELDRGLDGIQRVLDKAIAGHPELGRNLRKSDRRLNVNPQAAGS
ncbi:PLP-dependent transferase [Meira miltonrushii]|uniref:PLP-dependent transferase n=1 Tax=Meira miltonrushii TaxID=1280837 RepID=A0A316VCZ0_9BASI|nr:PLP-dependent transferase [Meira miltonrushii]PWN35350.1 PLP-dependent transferase [Meira miltonrushii]